MIKPIKGGAVNLSCGFAAEVARAPQPLAVLNNGDIVEIENLTLDLSTVRATLAKQLQEKNGLDARFTAIMELIRQTR
jgi:hypothetical protein